MNIKTLAHMALVVDDLEKSRWFYCDVLGMTDLKRPDTFKFRGAWFQAGDSEIHLFLKEDTVALPGFPDAGIAAKTGLATHIAFEVDDLDVIVRALQAHKLEIVGGPMPRGDGVVQLYLYDPDGYLVEFFQHSPDAGTGGATRDPVREE